MHPDRKPANQDVSRLCDEAGALLDEGRFTSDAHERLARALSQDARNPLVHYRLGLIYGDTGRLAEALQAYDTAIALGPADPKAHNNRGAILQRLGQLDDAAAAFERSLALAPELAPAYVNLGNLCVQQGMRAEAIAIFQRAIDCGLDAALFGQYIASISGVVNTRSPDSWVRSTFDNFAPLFDQHLQKLGYTAPQALADLLRQNADGDMSVAVDLGCGTGMCGVYLAGLSKRLIGVDLSEKMLALARQRALYDDLYLAEIHEWLQNAESASVDIVVAADVFIYIGLLDRAFDEIARVYLPRPGGWFAFSIEEQTQERDYVLRQSGRYAQSDGYIRTLAGRRFDVTVSRAIDLRKEAGVPLAGRLYLLRKT